MAGRACPDGRSTRRNRKCGRHLRVRNGLPYSGPIVPQTVARPPVARNDVLLRRVGSEWVLFDARKDRAHVLNLTAAVVWTYCDGAVGKTH